ncbi:MAG: PAS domain S-box protein [Planctomycetes bacterium]|nr:PAS domain S-box protein [Planctomycetota bacterium]
MPNKVSQWEAQESVWVQIIQQMEELYAELADSQAEIERHAEELRDAKKLVDNIIRSMSDVLIAVDSSGTITLVNEAVDRLFGFSEEELEGATLAKLLPGEAQKQKWSWSRLSRRIRKSGSLREVETRWQARRGNLIPVGVTVSALRDEWEEVAGAVLVVRDLRERKRRIAEAQAATAAAREKARELEEANENLKRLQDELVQAAKMSSLGRLAAGVAHELNNPLGGIMLYSDLLLEDIPKGDTRRPTVEKIADQTSRCRSIVQDLLEFSRPAQAASRPVDINSLLEEAVNILEGQQVFHNVSSHWKLAEEIPSLTGDPDRLRQAFLNIVLNAVEAMEGKGELYLRTSVKDGKVTIEIQDSGCGLTEEQQEHLFEPFYTTKETGTGLGLPVTYGIIERHGGEIEAESEKGQGATFRISLPLTEEGERDE